MSWEVLPNPKRLDKATIYSLSNDISLVELLKNSNSLRSLNFYILEAKIPGDSNDISLEDIRESQLVDIIEVLYRKMRNDISSALGHISVISVCSDAQSPIYASLKLEWWA